MEKPATPILPDIEGMKVLTPLEMNNIHFDRRHTVLTPAVLDAIASKSKSTSPREDDI